MLQARMEDQEEVPPQGPSGGGTVIQEYQPYVPNTGSGGSGTPYVAQPTPTYAPTPMSPPTWNEPTTNQQPGGGTIPPFVYPPVDLPPPPAPPDVPPVGYTPPELPYPGPQEYQTDPGQVVTVGPASYDGSIAALFSNPAVRKGMLWGLGIAGAVGIGILIVRRRG